MGKLALFVEFLEREGRRVGNELSDAAASCGIAISGRDSKTRDVFLKSFYKNNLQYTTGLSNALELYRFFTFALPTLAHPWSRRRMVKPPDAATRFLHQEAIDLGL